MLLDEAVRRGEEDLALPFFGFELLLWDENLRLLSSSSSLLLQVTNVSSSSSSSSFRGIVLLVLNA